MSIIEQAVRDGMQDRVDDAAARARLVATVAGTIDATRLADLIRQAVRTKKVLVQVQPKHIGITNEVASDVIADAVHSRFPELRVDVDTHDFNVMRPVRLTIMWNVTLSTRPAEAPTT